MVLYFLLANKANNKNSTTETLGSNLRKKSDWNLNLS